MWATDLNGVHNLKFYKLFEEKKLSLITLSKFQDGLFPAHWNKHVIYFMIPDWVYDYPIPQNKKNYIYASSLMKGYPYTLQMWKYLKDEIKDVIRFYKSMRHEFPSFKEMKVDVKNILTELKKQKTNLNK